MAFLAAMVRQIRDVDPGVPISIGTQGCPGIGGPEDLDLLDPFVDVHAVHPYWIPSPRRTAERHAEDFAGMLRHLDRRCGESDVSLLSAGTWAA